MDKWKKRLAEIVAKLEGFKGGDLNDEQIAEVNALSDEFNGLQAKIAAQEKIDNMNAQASTSTRTTAAAAPAAKIEVGSEGFERDPKGGFKNSGDFFRTVAKAASGEIDPRLRASVGQKEKIGEQGGYLVPSDIRTEIQEKVVGDESLLPRTAQFKTESNNLVLPVSEVAPWDGTGIQSYWEGEQGSYQKTKHKWGSTSLRLHKLTALVPVTEELLEDAPALESYIKMYAPSSMLHKVNSAIICGDGVGKPSGFLGSGFTVSIAKESAQTADTINFQNITKMIGRILPASFAKSVWIVNPAVMDQLRTMKFDLTSSTPIPVYLPPSGVAAAPFGTLYGRPILPMLGGTKALGDQGDISLVDLSYYISALKVQGIKSEVSTHVYFDTGEVAFKFSMRMAGQCPFKSPVTPENGTFPMSGFVTLDDRA